MTAQADTAHLIVSEERKIHVTGLVEAGHSPTAAAWDFARSVIQTLWKPEYDIGVWDYRVDVAPDTHELVILDATAFGEWDESIGWASPESFWGSVDDDIRALTGDGWRVVSCR
jgi:hypothetical protein